MEPIHSGACSLRSLEMSCRRSFKHRSKDPTSHNAVTPRLQRETNEAALCMELERCRGEPLETDDLSDPLCACLHADHFVGLREKLLRVCHIETPSHFCRQLLVGFFSGEFTRLGGREPDLFGVGGAWPAVFFCFLIYTSAS